MTLSVLYRLTLFALIFARLNFQVFRELTKIAKFKTREKIKHLANFTHAKTITTIINLQIQTIA